MNAVVERLKRVERPWVRFVLLRGRATLHWMLHGHAIRRRSVDAYAAATSEPRLHIGAGPNRIAGWLNSDLINGDIYLDLERKLPFPDSTFAYVYGEHIIEHIDEARALRLLDEIRRILRPGGVVRLTTPDLRKIIALYEDRNPVIDRESYARFLDQMTGKHHGQAAQLFNDYLRMWGHRFIYDEEDLTAKLQGAGFEGIVREQPNHSEHPVLRDIERHGGEPWVNEAEAMCLEGTAPG